MIERLLQRIFDLLVLLVVLAFALGVMAGFVREGVRAVAALVGHVLVPAMGVVAGVVGIGLLGVGAVVGVRLVRSGRPARADRRRRPGSSRGRSDVSVVSQ